MSVDLLQEKIRKCKTPAMVELAMEKSWIPEAYLQAHGGEVPAAWNAYCRELLEAMKELIPAVRFSLGSCAVRGAAGVQALENTMRTAKELGYFVVLDAPQLLSSADAQSLAEAWKERLCCDAMVVTPWLGSDVIRPLAAACKEGKVLFVVARSANKTAFELQDLLTGSRHVHVAAMDLVNRHGEAMIGKYGYSQVGALVGATAVNVIKSLRTKYGKAFLLVDGSDYSGANAKNCSYAFDKFGRGAIVCAGSSIIGAWAEEGASQDAVEAAVQAIGRMKKNLGRYVTIL